MHIGLVIETKQDRRLTILVWIKSKLDPCLHRMDAVKALESPPK